jgi:hypothetical protein
VYCFNDTYNYIGDSILSYPGNIEDNNKQKSNIFYNSIIVNKIAITRNFINIPLYDKISDVTMVITSCNRIKLLFKTINSFTKFNTHIINKMILIEDSGLVDKSYLSAKLSNLIPVENLDVIINDVNLGQMRSVDKAYIKVSTSYIFHCEDDWYFYKYSFIEKSKKLFEIYEQPEKENLLQVWIRNHNEMVTFAPFTKYGSLLEDNSIKYFYVFSSNHHWKGFSMNPGLKKLEDYQNIGSYEKLVNDFSYMCKYCVFESLIGLYYFNKGFVTLSLDNEGYAEHLGWEHSVKFGKGNTISHYDESITSDSLNFVNAAYSIIDQCI